MNDWRILGLVLAAAFAAWLGLRVLALSLVTNLACGLEDEALSHAHTLDTAQAASARAVPLLEAIVAALELE